MLHDTNPEIWPRNINMNFQSDMKILMTKRKKKVCEFNPV